MELGGDRGREEEDREGPGAVLTKSKPPSQFICSPAWSMQTFSSNIPGIGPHRPTGQAKAYPG